jgi:DNA-binding NarL/FixJ family response regulator
MVAHPWELYAFSDPVMASNLLRLGARVVLTKPIGARALVEAVQLALS